MLRRRREKDLLIHGACTCNTLALFFTLNLTQIDAETHFDPLLPAPDVPDSSHDATSQVPSHELQPVDDTLKSSSDINADIDAQYNESLQKDGLVPPPTLTAEQLRAARLKYFTKSAAASDDVARPTSSAAANDDVARQTKDLALELHRLHMADRSCCDEMALALTTAGVESLRSFKGLAADDIATWMRSIDLHFRFSPLHIIRIQLYVRSVEENERIVNQIVISSDSSPNGDSDSSVYTQQKVSGAQAAPTVLSGGRPLRSCRAGSNSSVYTLPEPGYDVSDPEKVLASPVSAAEKRPAPSKLSSDDDAPLVQPCKRVQAMEVQAKESGYPSVGGQPVATFQAANSHSAKDWLLNYFKECHTHGHPRCVNSRYVYTLAIAGRLA